jgi:hypothetical protein
MHSIQACLAPYRCDLCRKNVQNKMENRMRVISKTTRDKFDVLVAEYTNLTGAPLREMCVQALASPYLLVNAGTVTSAIYHAEELLGATTDGVVLSEWLKEEGLPAALEAIITDRSQRRTKLFTYKVDGKWMARGATPLNAVDDKTLFAALERRGLCGTKLAVIYAEYDDAHIDVHKPTAPVFTAHGLAWHTSVAAGPDPWAAEQYFA